jgi:peptidoglycan-associated lipoprotein
MDRCNLRVIWRLDGRSCDASHERSLAGPRAGRRGGVLRGQEQEAGDGRWGTPGHGRQQPGRGSRHHRAAAGQRSVPPGRDLLRFAFDSSDLDEAARGKLAENAEWLKKDGARTLTIEGHTDEVGTPEYNLGLGERRARATKDYLVRMGIQEKRISIITYGEERPAGSEDSKNRRSMFIATKKK